MDLKIPKANVNASLLKRAIAFIIDFFIIEFIVVAPFGKIVSDYVVDGSFVETLNWMMSNDALFGELYGIIVAITLLSIAYFMVFEYKYGQSIGKMIMKLKVISLTKKNHVWQHLVRSLFLIPLYPLTFIDLIYVFFNQENQRILEYLSKTKVVGV